MKFIDLLRTAIGNTFRSKARTILTVIAIFIGSFTLTLTSGIGTGVNDYIDKTVAAFGNENALFVQKVSEQSAGTGQDSGPTEYDPDSSEVKLGFGSVSGLTDSDIDKIKKIDGVGSVDPMYMVTPTYLQSPNGKKFQLSLGSPPEADGLQLEAGEAPERSKDEILLPASWVEPLGLGSNQDAVGKTVKIDMRNAVEKDKTFSVTISGVAQASLAGASDNPIPSADLNKKLYDYQTSGSPRSVPNSYFTATATVDDMSKVGSIKSQLADESMSGNTVEDQLGMFRAVINGIVWILNSFAIIALLAAGFGIVNTLLMSVQERTREIGLMKALGMSGGRVFGLFSLEAIFIGFLGSAIGAAVGVAAGSIISGVLSHGLLSTLPGLSLFLFDPLKTALIILSVMFIAFLAGTIPAVRAARQDPITALRYE
ncbi:ABC transporter permease [Kocuria sp.]|uniref:ABC transporter permease n=1 Tax=Kocuria sp. TaxID=1871328 RepID=UPI0026DD0FE4|nr:ABC transporter permease [Kocuria sp.]MDO4918158.1 ABC transporter permease [Kocuria sp.]